MIIGLVNIKKIVEGNSLKFQLMKKKILKKKKKKKIKKKKKRNKNIKKNK